jgi:hypothetical protein
MANIWNLLCLKLCNSVVQRYFWLLVEFKCWRETFTLPKRATTEHKLCSFGF